MPLPRRYWHDMTTVDFHDKEVGSWIAVLPIAAIEQHGPHLPLFTDSCIAEGQIARVIELLPETAPVTFLPVQTVGKSNEHIFAPGTLTIGWEIIAKAWLDIGDSVARAGLRKLILITSHGGNVPIMDIVARELRIRHGMLAVATSWARFGQPDGLFPPEEFVYGIHGGDIETSLMLHLRPDLVRMEQARDFRSTQNQLIDTMRQLRAHGPVQYGWQAQDLNPLGAVGNAARATAEKGRRSLDHAARAFLDLISDLQRFDLAGLWRPTAETHQEG